MNRTSKLTYELNNLVALYKEEKQANEIYSTDELRAQLLQDFLKGIAKTGDIETNLYAGLFNGGIILILDGIRTRRLNDIKRRRAITVRRIENLSKSFKLAPLPI